MTDCSVRNKDRRLPSLIVPPRWPGWCSGISMTCAHWKWHCYNAATNPQVKQYCICRIVNQQLNIYIAVLYMMHSVIQDIEINLNYNTCYKVFSISADVLFFPLSTFNFQFTHKRTMITVYICCDHLALSLHISHESGNSHNGFSHDNSTTNTTIVTLLSL